MRQFNLSFLFFIIVIIGLTFVSCGRPAKRDGVVKAIPVEKCQNPGTAQNVKIDIPGSKVTAGKTVQIPIGKSLKVSITFTPLTECDNAGFQILLKGVGNPLTLGHGGIGKIEAMQSKTVQVDMNTDRVREGTKGNLYFSIACHYLLLVCREANAEFVR